MSTLLRDKLRTGNGALGLAKQQPQRFILSKALTRSRTRACCIAGLLAICALWMVTPSSGELYDPKKHTSVQENYDPGTDDIVNSIVVPSYNEADNMHPLVSRIYQSLPPEQVRQTEILIVDDDSQDATQETIDRLREGGYNVHLHVRKGERGLSSAVLHGFSLAHGSKLVVMDADLQHPPENVKDLLEALPDRPEGASIQPPQFALGTRYGSGNSIDRDWPMYRRVISWGARLLSRPLTSAEDPMGGFFALRRDLFMQAQPLNPSGFKIGLELLLKTPLKPRELVHVPYSFAKRSTGASKLGVKVMARYVGQLLALYQWKFGVLFYGFTFCLVASAAWVALILVDFLVITGGYSHTGIGRVVLGDRRKRRRTRSDV